MKRIFTLISAIAVTSLVNAQTYPAAGTYSQTGFYDDFSSVGVTSETNDNAGAWWWGKQSLGDDGTCTAKTGADKTACEAFASIFDRDAATNGSMQVLISQANDGYNPFGIDLSAEPMDITGNQTIEMSITNNHATKDIILTLALTSTDNGGDSPTINATKGGANFLSTIPAGQTKVITFDLTDGKHKKWVNGVSSLLTGFDPANLISIEFTFDYGWNDGLGLTEGTEANHPITFNYVKIGGGSSNSVNELSNNPLNVYPNPVDGSKILNFPTQLETVQIVNIIGEVVLRENNTSSMNLNGLNAGVYFVRSNEGTARVIVK